MNIKISTPVGLIIILLVAGSVGFMVLYQLIQIANIRAAVIERQLEEIK